MPGPLVFTVGHSTRPIEEFLSLLRSHDVATLVDVRTVPRSRRNPQFNSETLAASLSEVGIEYVHESGLGGFRRASADSPNKAWRNASFRGYADYMQGSDFREHLARLMQRAREQRIALMCAEAVPWRCHRSLIADALLVHGFRVEEISGVKRSQPHALTPFARVEGTRITYPAQESEAA